MLCICSFYANLTVHMIQSHAEFLLFIVLVAVFFSGKQKRQARFRQLIPDLKGVLDFHVDEHVIQCAFNSFHRNFSARTKSIESTCGQTIKTAIAINVMIYIYIYIQFRFGRFYLYRELCRIIQMNLGVLRLRIIFGRFSFYYYRTR